MKTVSEINVAPEGAKIMIMARIWEDRGKFRWATPNGSEGSEETFEEAEREAREAEEFRSE